MKIKLENIDKLYTKKKTVIKALDNFSLEIPNNAITAIIGPSGSGKSTLLNVIAGLTSYSGGNVYFDDINVNKKKPNLRNIGFVFQSYALYPYLTVKDNILFPLSKNVSKEDKEKKLLEISSLLNISNLLDRKSDELSGGEMQRVAIARALIKSPELLLLDEPFSALDMKNRKEAGEFIQKIQKELNITIVLVTHNQKEAFEIADNIVIINEGKLIFSGTCCELKKLKDNDFIKEFILEEGNCK